MKVLLVNAVCGVGSTGRICTDLHDMLISKGDEATIAFAHGNPSRITPQDTFRINGKRGYYCHNILARLSDRAGFFSSKATKRFIRFIKEYRPDVIHLHNLHGFYINIRILFEYLATANIPVVWTLHDCWAFTGHCAHYSYEDCSRWMTLCHNCPLRHTYPQSLFFDQSTKNFQDKKKLFTSIKNLHITTPSYWLADQVKKSFLSQYPVTAIYNGIDLQTFKPTKSDVLKKLDINESKTVLLAVANDWSARKGLNDLIEINNRLDHTKYQMIIVGLDKKRIEKLDKTIIGIERTDSIKQLVELYSMADIFINPSYEETMGMVTAESLACGTPVIVYNKTAVPEIPDSNSGIVVPAGNISEVIANLDKARTLKSQDCVKRACSFELNQQYEKYYNLYQTCLTQR